MHLLDGWVLTGVAMLILAATLGEARMMGLVLDWVRGEGICEVAASFEIIWRTHIGYGPGPAKSLRTMSSNSLSVDGSMFGSQSRY
jgi:hypothetical protein